VETRIPLLDIEEQRQLFGPYDRHAKEMSRRFGVRMSAKNGALRLRGGGDQLSTIASRIEDILADIRSSEMEPPPAEIEARLLGDVASTKKTPEASPKERGHRSGSRMPEARSDAQAKYLQAMRDSDLVLASGPAGTGKTFLAVAAAVRHLQAGRVSRLVLTRPAIEAGEHLGFLPGDYEAKVDPYLRPLYDALRDILGPTGFRRLKSLDLLEIAPLAFMRGRTLARSFIILDEAQNCTPGQMKMFLTRIGEGSKAVVSGDLTQTDLPGGVSGLTDAVNRLDGIEGVSVVSLGACDIQRSGLVRRVVEAYGNE
jgi:phosphate starvation-inducible PhoH-like protein|tara:strand:+ start:21565 stop:22503 length:939 start_codon:yes stop_codon:yes gene_type:complete